MKLKKWEIALCAAVIITILWGLNTERQQQGLADKLIRFHVIANSDAEEDQRVKLEVRDAVLAELEPLLEGSENRVAAEEIINLNLSEITETANHELAVQGSTDKATVTLTEEAYPTRYYDTFTLPAGNYISLCVTIGEGDGHNWWCVVFPPICTAAAVEDAETVGLTEDEMKLITEEDSGTVIRFKTLEIIAKVREWFE